MIEAISRGCKGTLSDGTLRYVVDIAPVDAAEAAALFGMPGSPIVLARLTQEAAKQSAQEEIIATENPKGGELAKLAGQWCASIKFQDWVRDNCMIDLEHIGSAEKAATQAIYDWCDVSSRAELDHNELAKASFNKHFRDPYSKYYKETV